MELDFLLIFVQSDPARRVKRLLDTPGIRPKDIPIIYSVIIGDQKICYCRQ